MQKDEENEGSEGSEYSGDTFKIKSETVRNYNKTIYYISSWVLKWLSDIFKI